MHVDTNNRPLILLLKLDVSLILGLHRFISVNTIICWLRGIILLLLRPLILLLLVLRRVNVLMDFVKVGMYFISVNLERTVGDTIPDSFTGFEICFDVQTGQKIGWLEQQRIVLKPHLLALKYPRVFHR